MQKPGQIHTEAGMMPNADLRFHERAYNKDWEMQYETIIIYNTCMS